VSSRRPQRQRQLTQMLIAGFTAIEHPRSNRRWPTATRNSTSTTRARTQARLPDLRVYGPIVERGRRRVRNRTGRYELQYEVEFPAAPEGSLLRRWVDLPRYEALLDGGKLADELEGDGE